MLDQDKMYTPIGQRGPATSQTAGQVLSKINKISLPFGNLNFPNSPASLWHMSNVKSAKSKKSNSVYVLKKVI